MRRRYVLDDRIGLELVMPERSWRDRPDMDPRFTAGFRASIVARARYLEDVVAERAAHGAVQYVILGAGLDTFAQRRTDLAARVRVFEVDRPGPRSGSGGAWASSGTRSRTGCDSSRPTSRSRAAGARSCWPRGSTRRSPP